MAKHNPHNKGKVKNLAYVERMLRQGRTPESLGLEVIGQGVCKAAYRFGNSVIKKNAQCGWNGDAVKNPPKWIKEFNARGPRTYKAGDYIIQEYVTVLSSINEYNKIPAYKVWKKLYAAGTSGDARYAGARDMHENNVGIDSEGNLVVFDW